MSKLSKEQQIEAIEKTIAELSKQVESLKKPEEEEFKFCDNGYSTWNAGNTSGNNGSVGICTERGRIFPTEALAVKYDKIITNSYKIAQAVAQLAPDYEPDWSNSDIWQYNLMFNNRSGQWFLDRWSVTITAGVVTFPESIKDKMLELVNSGALGLEV